MEKREITKDTPLAMMTIGELVDYLGLAPEEDPQPGKNYVYGLRGIQDLFKVSHTTAQIYKDGILKEAIFQSGRKIMVDVDKAIELFKQHRKQVI